MFTNNFIHTVYTIIELLLYSKHHSTGKDAPKIFFADQEVHNIISHGNEYVVRGFNVPGNGGDNVTTHDELAGLCLAFLGT